MIKNSDTLDTASGDDMTTALLHEFPPAPVLLQSTITQKPLYQLEP